MERGHDARITGRGPLARWKLKFVNRAIYIEAWEDYLL